MTAGPLEDSAVRLLPGGVPIVSLMEPGSEAVFSLMEPPDFQGHGATCKVG
jgi:hypothetical protein